jgi:hypothetical protein
MILLCLISVLSCKKGENDTPKKQLLFPLSVGNTWDYGEIKFKITDKYSIKHNHKTIDVYSFGQIIGDDSIAFNYKGLYSYDEFGNIYCNGGTLPMDTLHISSLYLKDTCVAKDSWVFYQVVTTGVYSKKLTNVEVNDTVEMICTSSDTLISIPLGKFRCKVFMYSFPDDADTRSFEFYYSRGVGLIKMMVKVNGIIRSTTILKSFHLN